MARGRVRKRSKLVDPFPVDVLVALAVGLTAFVTYIAVDYLRPKCPPSVQPAVAASYAVEVPPKVFKLHI